MGAPGLGSTAVLKWNRFEAPPRGFTRAEAHTHPPRRQSQSSAQITRQNKTNHN